MTQPGPFQSGPPGPQYPAGPPLQDPGWSFPPPPPAPGGPVGPTDPPSGGPTPWLLVLAGFLAVVLVAAVAGGVAFVLASRDDDGGDQAAPTVPEVSTTATSEPATGTEECPSGDAEVVASGDEELDAVVAELAAFVEEERCLEFLEPVSVDLADEGEFQELLLEDFAEDEQELLDSQDVFRALGFIDADTDLEAEYRALLGAGVLGFYDPETAELVVRAGDITPLTRITIAHELVHALDDQHFDLDRQEYDDAPSEVATGFSALVEGNASRVEDEYRASLSDEEAADAAAEETALAGGIDPDIPVILLQFLQAPYIYGPDLVDAVLDEGGQERLDAAFDEPPTTSEQFLFPDVFLDGEDAVDVPAPEADGEVFDDGAFGALALGYLLLESAGQDASQAAVQGWGGDAYVAWREGDRTCLRSSFVGDTPEDTDEIAEALTTWADTQDDAQIDRSGDQVQLTACA